MMVRVGVEQPTDHMLILRMMFPGLAFEELDASLTQSDGDFDPFHRERRGPRGEGESQERP